jgi:hypothetical protein
VDRFDVAASELALDRNGDDGAGMDHINWLSR